MLDGEWLGLTLLFLAGEEDPSHLILYDLGPLRPSFLAGLQKLIEVIQRLRLFLFGGICGVAWVVMEDSCVSMG